MTEVPAHWNEARFKHVLADKKKVPRPDLPAGSISFGRVVFKDAEIFSEETKASYQEVLAGEFLVNPLNLNYDLLSLRTALASIDVVVSTGYIVLQSCGRLNPNYTRWLLQQFDVAHMKTLGAGVRQTINYADIGNSYFFEPPLPEQTQIAAFLDHETAKIDRLIEKQEELIRLLKEKRQAVISHAVTKGLNPHAPLKDSGIEWLGQVPAHWKISELRYEVKPETSITYGIVQAGPDVEDGIPYIKTSDMSGDALPFEGYSKTSRTIAESFARSMVAPNDIVIAIRASVGKCHLVPQELAGANLTQGTAKISPALEHSFKFFYWYLSSDQSQAYFDSVAKGATFREITLEKLRKAPITLPPVDEQRAIVGQVEAQHKRFASLIRAAQEQTTLLQERRTALVSAAVTGKIDVRHWQSPSDS